MKRVMIVAVLVIVAAVAGIVRSHTRNGLHFSGSASAQPGPRCGTRFQELRSVARR